MLVAISEAHILEMERDPDVFIAGIDVKFGVFGQSRGLYERFGERRVVNTPISERAIAGLAVGAAAVGLRPIIELMFIDIVTVCMDEIANQMAKMKYMFGGKSRLPIVVRMASGGGRNMGAQHSQSLEAWLCHIPGLKVVMPSTPYDAKGLLIASIRDDNPVMFLENKRALALPGEVPDESYEVPLGLADVKRAGTDVTVVATGHLVLDALHAAEVLVERGISIEVVDPRTLSPLDMDTIVRSAKKTGRAMVAEEAVRFCGVGAEIAAGIHEAAFDELLAPVMRVGAPFSPVPFSPSLESAWLPGAEEIIATVEELLRDR